MIVRSIADLSDDDSRPRMRDIDAASRRQLEQELTRSREFRRSRAELESGGRASDVANTGAGQRADANARARVDRPTRAEADARARLQGTDNPLALDLRRPRNGAPGADQLSDDARRGADAENRRRYRTLRVPTNEADQQRQRGDRPNTQGNLQDESRRRLDQLRRQAQSDQLRQQAQPRQRTREPNALERLIPNQGQPNLGQPNQRQPQLPGAARQEFERRLNLDQMQRAEPRRGPQPGADIWRGRGGDPTDAARRAMDSGRSRGPSPQAVSPRENRNQRPSPRPNLERGGQRGSQAGGIPGFRGDRGNRGGGERGNRGGERGNRGGNGRG